MKRLSLLFFVFLLALLLPAGAVYASSRNGNVIESGQVVNRDIVIPGGDLIIEEGAMVNGDVVVFGGNLTMAGRVNGDVTVFGGNVELAGAVSGDLVVFGGNVEVAPSANVTGSCALMGGSVRGQGRTGLHCSSFSRLPEWSLPAAPFVFTPPFRPHMDPAAYFWSWNLLFRGVVEVIGQTFVFGLMALLVAALFPQHLRQVGQAVKEKPVASGVVGVLTAVAVPSLALLLLVLSALLILVCVGLLGFPLVFLLLLGLAAAGLMGWIAAGHLLGEKLAEALKLSNRSIAVTAVLGTATLTLVMGLMQLAGGLGAFGGWLITMTIICVGLGAVTLTKFGAHPYPHVIHTGHSGKVDEVLDTMPK